MILRALLLNILIIPQAMAFMNIESIRQSAKEGTAGSVGLKVNGQTGNADKFAGEASSLTLHRSDANEYLLAGKYRYGESRHVKDTHEGNIHLRYTRQVNAWAAGEVFEQTEFDEFKNLKRRDLLGGGLRSRLEKKEANAVFLGTGLFYEHEDFTGNIESEETVRANIYLSFVRTFSDHVSGSIVAYYQPSFEGLNDTRAQLDSALQVKLAERLALTVEYDLQYDSEPAPGVKQLNTTYLMGLAYAY